MEIKKVKTTPAMAKDWLEKFNTGNRSKKPRAIVTYMQDMRNGKWKEDTGETIKFGISGRLIDGQNRLTAQMRTGKTINWDVAYGVEDAVFDVLDTGTKRSPNDVFAIAGVKNSSGMAGSIICYLSLKRGVTATNNDNQRPNNTTILAEYQRREEYWKEAFHKCDRWYKSFSRVLAPSTVLGIYSLLYDKNREHADLFMAQVCTGENITNKTISVLRTRLVDDRVSKKKMPTALKNAMIIKTWNLFRSGKEIKVLRLDIIETEGFPKPQ